MIRHLLLIKLKPGTTEEQIEAFRSALATVPFEGRKNALFARDLGIREGNADIVIMNDFDNEEIFHAWEADPNHDRGRQEFLAPIADRRERSQIQV
jgi:hypothetical protein